MDDDGLILNVDLDYAQPKKTATKERTRREKPHTSKTPKRKIDTRIDEPSSNNIVQGALEPPRKRQRVAPSPKQASVRYTSFSPPIEVPLEPEQPTPSSKPSGHIISSLFTSNPTVHLPTPPSKPSTSQAPSNAPLRDASTFEGLGLNPLIAKHLKDRMQLDKPTAIQRSTLSALLNEDLTSSQRDLFIQSQTGSGKTLSFLLPIINDLLPLSSLSWIDRSVGTLAIIIAPTRELAKQISDVLEILLQMRLSPRESERDSDDLGPRLTRWLISGLLVGGGTRTHEKARLRKGIPILVSTPGRLLDHLQNTESFHVAKCRWLVLDEADRLMELGFQETLDGIIKSLDGRRNIALNAAKEGGAYSGEGVGGWDWDVRRRTILCSATMREDVQKLAGTALANPLVVKGSASDSIIPSLDKVLDTTAVGPTAPSASQKFTPPSQLTQRYIVVPLKLRLVALVSLLRSILTQSKTDSKRAGSSKGSKILVFFDCTDSVDFHWELLGGTTMSAEGSGSQDKAAAAGEVAVRSHSSLLPDTSIFRLHGSLPLSARQAAVKGFSSSKKDDPSSPEQQPQSAMSILFCTSVAARGLDLPLVRAVVQYDLPTEGGCNEYVHRVGRTARAGKGGEAWAFVSPEETAWVKWVEDKMEGLESETDTGSVVATTSSRLIPVESEEVLRSGFGGKGSEAQQRATEVQLAFERWVLEDKVHSTLAKKAFQSHMRAYATHPADEKHIFHVRNLHIGHLAKAFALREAPSDLKGSPTKKAAKTSSTKKPKASESRAQRPATAAPVRRGKLSVADRMKEVMKAQGKLTKKDGRLLNSAGADEFQVAATDVLQRLVGGR